MASDINMLRTIKKPINMSIMPPAIHHPHPLGKCGPAATTSWTTPAKMSSQPNIWDAMA